MKCIPIVLAACLSAAVAQGQVTSFEDDFETSDPCTSGDWQCRGNSDGRQPPTPWTASWISPDFGPCFPDPANPVQPADWTTCNLYDPPEGYVLITPAVIGKGGAIFRTEKLYFDSFRLTAVVEMRNPAGACGGVPADGMSIFIKGDNDVPIMGGLGGGLGVIYADNQPMMYFGFDNYNNGAGVPDQNDANHVEFGYSPTGFPTWPMNPQVSVHLNAPLNNGLMNTSNRFMIQVQVKAGFVTCDIGNEDIGMPMTRMYQYQIPNFEPFDGYLGMAGSTGDCIQNHIVHSIKLEDITGICTLPPATAARKITNVTRTDKFPLYDDGDQVSVSISVSDIRGEEQINLDPDCGVPAELTVVENVPAGWTVTEASDGGTIAGGQVTWVLKDAGVAPRVLTYKTVAVGGSGNQVNFAGTIQETNVEKANPYGITGDGSLYTPFTDLGFIRTWNILGPFAWVNPPTGDHTFSCTGGTNGDQLAYEEDPFTNPGVYTPVDWIVNQDGSVTEAGILPFPNLITKPAYGGDGRGAGARAAGLTVGAGLAGAVVTDRFPAWKAVFSPNDGIDFNSTDVFGYEADDAVTLALIYVTNTTEEPIVTTIGEGSDDAMVVQVNDVVPSVVGAQCRGWGGTNQEQDVIPNVTLNPGENRILVKVADGGGGYGFRLRFQHPDSQTTMPGLATTPGLMPPTITVSYESKDNPAKKAIRKLEKDTYSLGETVGVSLAITAPVASDVILREVIPGAAAVTDISDGGTVVGDAIEWTIAGVTSKTVTYKIAADPCLSALQFSGSTITVGSDEVLVVGDSSMTRSFTEGALGSWTAKDIGLKAGEPAGASEAIAAQEVDIISRAEAGGVRGTLDDFRFVSIPETGDFEVSAKIECLEDTGSNGQAGVMARASDAADAAFALLGLKVDTATVGAWTLSATYRNDTKRLMKFLTLTADNKVVDALPIYLKLVRTGSTLSFQRSADGVSYTEIGTKVIGTGGTSANPDINLTDNPIVGLAVASARSYFGSVSGPPFLEVAPEPPVNVGAVGGTKKVTVSWQPPADPTGITGYEVVRDGSVVATVAAPGTSYEDTGLQDGTKYCYKLRSVKGALKSVDSSEACATTLPGGVQFRRGDTNDDGKVDLSDAIVTLGYLFQGGTTPTCFDAADADDSGVLDLTDGIYPLTWLFQGGPEPPAPGPKNCGLDTTPQKPGQKPFPPCVYTKCP